jgi:choline monooxygenase
MSLDNSDLTPSDFRVDPDIRVAETLPARAFRDPAFLARELDTVFARHFVLVPERSARERADDPRTLAEMVASRGARAPFQLLGRPLFLQRGWDDDELRCFPNTCTHAWYPLVTGPSRGHAIVCAQHGRKFDCAGRFTAQPGFKALPDFPRACDHLASLPLATWRELTFVSIGAPAAPFGETFAELAASTAKLPPTAPVAAPDEAREVAGNWKQHAWNYMDRFHVSYIHRAPGGLADAIDLDSYKTELYARTALQWAWAKDPAHGFDPAELPERFHDPGGRRVFALWWFVFPNLTLNFYPWGLSVNLYQPVPGDPERTQFLWYHRVADAAKYARRDRDWLSAQVDAEDVDAMAQVRRGLRSGFAPRGRFAPVEETGPHWFHRLVYRAVFEGA